MDLDYIWAVKLKDGKTVSQFEADGRENRFGDIDPKAVECVMWQPAVKGELPSCTVQLRDCEVADVFRSHTVAVKKQGIQDEVTYYCIRVKDRFTVAIDKNGNVRVE